MTPISDDMVERAKGLGAIRHYVEMRQRMPLRGIGDSIHHIHASTEYEAELTLSDLILALEDTAALEGSVAVPAWQPIETAPKDGFEIDLWCLNVADGGEARFAEMFWNESGKWEDWRSYILEPKYKPTHWMSAPEPPALPRQKAAQPGGFPYCCTDDKFKCPDPDGCALSGCEKAQAVPRQERGGATK
jgi:hypothetical protein